MRTLRAVHKLGDTTTRVGDPLDEEVDIGPLARLDLRDELHLQVVESVRHGARKLLGGEIPEGPGAYYRATVLTDVRMGQPAYEAELPMGALAVEGVPEEPDLDTDRFAEMIRAAAAAASASEPGQAS